MSLSIVHGNVLDSNAEAIILTIDGARQGMEGSIARQFARKWPDVWHEIEDETPYPLPPGQVFDYEPVAECTFRIIMVASTLAHIGNLTENYLKGIVRTAFEETLNKAAEYNINKIATAVMVGGWRLKPQAAFLAMAEGYEAAVHNCENVDVDVYLPEVTQFELIQSLARSLGWR